MQWHLKSPESQLFVSLFVQAQIKENIEAPHHWHLWGETTSDWWFTSQRASNTEELMMSSWQEFRKVDILLTLLTQGSKLPSMKSMKTIVSLKMARFCSMIQGGGNCINHWSVSVIYKWDLNFVNTVPADDPAPNGAWSSAVTLSKFLLISMISCNFYSYGWEVLVDSSGTLSVKFSRGWLCLKLFQIEWL